MSADLLLTLTWSLLTISATTVTLHLYRNAGILVASQNLIMAVCALVDALCLRAGFHPVAALALAVLTGISIGLLHLPVLFRTGVTLLLVLTALASFILVEMWLAFPAVTGGSGGILLPQEVSKYNTVIFLIIILIVSGFYLNHISSSTSMQFDWKTLKTLGPTSGAFGVNYFRLYFILFLLYGLVVGFSGVAAVRYLGYVSVSIFSLSWSLAIVLIVISLSKQPFTYLVLLCIIYGTVRVMLRQTVLASSFWSNIFEIAFPFILLAIVLYDKKVFSNRKSIVS